jgi:hypothetical protein
LKRPEKKTLSIAIATLATWVLIAWILLNLRGLDGADQIDASTKLLRILCAGASLLLLMTCLVLSAGLSRIARDAESEQRFPPSSAPQLATLRAVEGESAWLMAARLRGWAALSLAAGTLIAGAGIAIALRGMPQPVQVKPVFFDCFGATPTPDGCPGATPPAVKSSPALVSDPRSARPHSPAPPTVARG